MIVLDKLVAERTPLLDQETILNQSKGYWFWRRTQNVVLAVLALAEKDPDVLFTGFVQGNVLEELFSNAYFMCYPRIWRGYP